MLSQLRPAVVSTLFFTLLLGLAYPLAVTGIGQLAFPSQAGGSLVRDAGGRVIGSRLLAQPFAAPAYLHPRPSAAGANGYDASGSSGSNLGPLNPALAERVAQDLFGHQAWRTMPTPAILISAKIRKSLVLRSSSYMV